VLGEDDFLDHGCLRVAVAIALTDTYPPKNPLTNAPGIAIYEKARFTWWEAKDQENTTGGGEGHTKPKVSPICGVPCSHDGKTDGRGVDNIAARNS